MCAYKRANNNNSVHWRVMAKVSERCASLHSANSCDQAFAHALIHCRAADTRLSSAIKNGGKRQAAEYLKEGMLYLKVINHLKKLEKKELNKDNCLN